MKQVPGLENVQSQVALLQKWLTGNMSFAQLRGKIDSDNPVDFLMSLSSESPSAHKRALKDFHSHWQVIGSMMAKLRRDGHDFAYGEMSRALRDKDYMVCGEEVPFDQTTSLTAIMFYPEITKRILDLVDFGESTETSQNFYDLYNYCWTIGPRIDFWESDLEMLEFIEKEFNGDILSYAEAYFTGMGKINNINSIDLFRELPSIMDIFLNNNYRADYRKAFEESYYYDLVLPTMNGIDAEIQNELLLYSMQPYSKEFFLKRGLVFLIPMEQKEVISLFSRVNQKKIATWKINCPSSFLKEGTDKKIKISLGIHPESEHELWKKIRPRTCSVGVSGGFGVMINPEDEYQKIGDKEKRYLLYGNGKKIFTGEK